jgi:hypothetical protein
MEREKEMTTPTPNWSTLGRQDTIQVISPNLPAIPGTVNMTAADRSILWMIRRGKDPGAA